jgi:hypothetical protein
MVDNSPTDLAAKARKTCRAGWAATEAWWKHVEANRSEFLRTIAQVASEDAHENRWDVTQWRVPSQIG